MRSQLVLSSLVLAVLLLSFVTVGCQSGVGLRVASAVSARPRPFSARVVHFDGFRDKLFPFSISGSRQYAGNSSIDPLRRTNEPLESVLGPDNELANGIANRNRLAPQQAPFSEIPQDAPQHDLNQQPPHSILDEPESAPEESGNPGDTGAAKAEVNLPSSEAFTRQSGKASLEIEQPDAINEDERLREARIQQLLDLLAKAEEQAAADVPPLPPTPILEQARDAELKKIETEEIPQKIETPREIVLRATATIPYQSIRSERVELLNVQQLAPAIPARPGLPAVAKPRVEGGPQARGWANQDWSRGIVPDFSALGQAAPEEVNFQPLPASQLPQSGDQTAETGVSTQNPQGQGRIVPELDANPATAARPIQKSSDRR